MSDPKTRAAVAEGRRESSGGSHQSLEGTGERDISNWDVTFSSLHPQAKGGANLQLETKARGQQQFSGNKAAIPSIMLGACHGFRYQERPGSSFHLCG